MKLLKLVSLLLFSITFHSCVEEEEKTMTISNSDTLHYSLGSFGDEEGASILQQARHYQISELKHEVNSGEISYRYKADSAYTGKDYVELRSARGSDGESRNKDVVIIKLTILVE